MSGVYSLTFTTGTGGTTGHDDFGHKSYGIILFVIERFNYALPREHFLLIIHYFIIMGYLNSDI